MSDDSGGSYDSGTGIWTIGNLAAGATTTLNLTIQLTEAGSLTNIATVSINETETDTTNNEDLACVSVPVALPCNEGGITLIAESGEISYQPIIIEDDDCPTCAPVKCLGVNITKITNN